MKQIRISNEVVLSGLALGDCKRGVPAREEGAFRVMDHYWAIGGNTFDSARLYNDGEADRALGKWMHSRGIARDAIRIVTKGSHPDPKAMFVSRLSPEEITRDLDESLSYLGEEYSDLHLLHRDDVKKPVSEIIPALSALVTAGKTRAIGVSNWTVGRIIEANEFALENGFEPIRCCQLHFSLAQTTPAQTGDITHVPMNDIEMTWYRESQLPIMCFGAQARGWFAARAEGREPTESPKRFYDILPENRRRLIRLQKLSAALGVSMSAVTTAYVRDRGLNAVVLSSFSSIQQLDEALEAEKFALTAAQIAYLETGVGDVTP
jgi:aryl-alcohol dehydrogenase-like predicted oxidoreductase